MGQTFFANSLSKKQNKELRLAAREKGVRLWELAEAVGVSEAYFSRLLRKELPENVRTTCLSAVEEIAQQRQGGQ